MEHERKGTEIKVKFDREEPIKRDRGKKQGSRENQVKQKLKISWTGKKCLKDEEEIVSNRN